MPSYMSPEEVANVPKRELFLSCGRLRTSSGRERNSWRVTWTAWRSALSVRIR